jgi:uroporphyrinogen decarboxylase
VDSRARVEAALALKRADRPPSASWGHAYRAEWSPAELAATTVERARRLEWDYVKFQPRATCFAEVFGSRYEPSGTGRKGPILVKPAVETLDDWARLPHAGAASPALADQVDAIGRVVAELGPSIPVIQTVFSPLTVAGYLVGKSKPRAVRELRKHPELVGPALDWIASALAQFAAESVRAGAAGIFYAISGYASEEAMPEEVYRELVLPHDRAVLDKLPPEAWFNVLHLCGSRLNFDLAKELPVQAVSWSIHNRGNPGLAEGRARSGRAVMGGVGQRTPLARDAAERIAAEVRAAIADTGGEGLLIAPGCSVPPWANEPALRSIVTAAAA